jgi:hypothetical protein
MKRVMTFNRTVMTIVAFGSFLIYPGCRNARELEPTPPEIARPQRALRSPLELKDVGDTKGAVRQAALFAHPLSVPGVNLEIRTILIQPREEAVLIAEYDGIVELRSGRVTTTIDGEKKDRITGDMWQVKKRSRQQFKVSGELAVARAIYLVPAQR